MKGTLRDTDAYQLANTQVGAIAADLDGNPVDDVILGEGLYGGGVVARNAALAAGLTAVPGDATGARMLVTLVHELSRRGGGIGSATVTEVPAP